MSKSKPKLTPAQMRVAIAKDVLKQIKAGRITIKHGVFALSGIDYDDEANYEQETVLNLKECTACAVGAGIICAMRLFNKISISQVDTPNPLMDFFSRKQVQAIEIAFEFGNGYYNFGESRRADWKAKRFGYEHKDPTERAGAIYRNIIRNNGVFNP